MARSSSVTLRSTIDVIFALGAASALNAKEHSSIDAHKARNALCFMRIPFYEDLKRHVLFAVKFEGVNFCFLILTLYIKNNHLRLFFTLL